MALRRTACLLLLALLAAPALADPREDLKAAWSKFIGLKAFRAEIHDAERGKVVARLAFQAPDRFRIETDGGPATVVIGDTGYVRMGERWMAVPMPVDRMTRQYRDEGLLRAEADKLQVADLGTDVLDGEAVRKYRYTTPDTGDTTQVAWVSQASGHVVQIVVENGRGQETRIRYRDFDDPGIRIDPPR